MTEELTDEKLDGLALFVADALRSNADQQARMRAASGSNGVGWAFMSVDNFPEIDLKAVAEQANRHGERLLVSIWDRDNVVQLVGEGERATARGRA